MRNMSVTVPSAPARAVDLETVLNIREQERQDVEVEGDEHPAEVGGDKRAPLVAGDFPIPGHPGLEVGGRRGGWRHGAPS